MYLANIFFSIQTGIVRRMTGRLVVDFHSIRPGHDLRYGLDGSKLINMGWKMPVSFEQSLEKMIKWTLEHQEWLEE